MHIRSRLVWWGIWKIRVARILKKELSCRQLVKGEEEGVEEGEGEEGKSPLKSLKILKRRKNQESQENQELKLSLNKCQLNNKFLS